MFDDQRADQRANQPPDQRRDVRPDQRSSHPARVLIVAATNARAEQLRGALVEQPPGRVEVVGVLRGPSLALTEVTRLLPEVLLIDLPAHRGGLALVEAVMATSPTPILCCGASAEPKGIAELAAAGALGVVPAGADWADTLRRSVLQSVGARVIRHPRGRLPARLPHQLTEPIEQVEEDQRPKVVAIGASTGGPPALAALLAELPLDLPAPVLVVQHMAAGFVTGLAQWLDAIVPLPVRVAAAGDRLRRGEVVLAPSGQHLVLRAGLVVELVAPSPGQFHVPSIDLALRSVAVVARSRAVGVLLTGMGRDGAAGLRAMREAGARTLAQDESTSAVFGMPGAACAEGAVDEVLALPLLAEAIRAACAASGSATREAIR